MYIYIHTYIYICTIYVASYTKKILRYHVLFSLESNSGYNIRPEYVILWEISLPKPYQWKGETSSLLSIS